MRPLRIVRYLADPETLLLLLFPRNRHSLMNETVTVTSLYQSHPPLSTSEVYR